ncbi:Flp family type IVb pilin [Nocardioides gilvus]|uniref:Flp family type IVb pilin n=1 Tax=Nocardioides gilvus TaxID=1735589 RepID=UPI000D746FEE|nr:Flp family type IVb pilin [Nocardioides gilvus]
MLLLLIRLAVSRLEAEKSERGASAVEYGLLVAGVAAIIVTAVFGFGGALNELMGESCGTITAWVNGADC